MVPVYIWGWHFHPQKCPSLGNKLNGHLSFRLQTYSTFNQTQSYKGHKISHLDELISHWYTERLSQTC